MRGAFPLPAFYPTSTETNHGRYRPNHYIVLKNSDRTGRGYIIRHLFVAGDFLLVNLIFWLTIGRAPSVIANTIQLRELWLMANVSYLPLVYILRRNSHEMRAIRMERVMRSTTILVFTHALLFLSMAAFVHITVVLSRTYMLFYGVLFVTLFVFHICGNWLLKKYRRRGYNYTRVVIVGTGPTARRLFDSMEHDAGFGYRVLGFFDDNPSDDFYSGVVYPLSELADFVAGRNVRQIFYTLSGQNEAHRLAVKIADDNVADFYYVPQIPPTLSRRFELHNIGSVPVLSVMRNPLKNPLNRGLKRTFDLAVSSVFLCFYPLIYIPVAIAIKLSSPGPVYFKQERTGYLGNSFECLKFRTMRVNANADKVQATKNDSRKTRVGDFLRRTSLDELPQFINVWKGDMSVVGPRPHMLKHTEEYTKIVDRYMVRHAVKPGITGWAQVNGYRGLTDEVWKMERRVEHDVWYIENWTFLLDIKIMIRTVLNALQGEKNAF